MLFLHDAEKHSEDALRTGYPALAELRAEGVVGAIGAGMYHTGMLTKLVQEGDVDAVMLSGHYTLLQHGALDDLLPACAEGAYFEYTPASQELVGRTHRIADVCEAHGVTLPQVAMAFPLRHPVVVGMRTVEEARSDVESFGAEIPDGVWADLRGEGLLDERAPTTA
ncbi:hypothetical protein [Streptomyces sp. NPDC005970]|uniref:hypothetical protein n=1 Tax=Streptomyces sp. NPDC005970 TaxID=3156723 RepID=UPI0033FF4563